MSIQFLALATRIRNELVEIKRLLTRIEEGWQRAVRSNDDFYRDSVALNLHGWYSGLERLFVLIAENIDGGLPKGENWHQALLLQMTQDISSIRPAVISEDTCGRLAEYRGFRHIVRNVYTFQFEIDKMTRLVVGVSEVFVRVEAELLAFASFLEQQ
jgi:hypothetical protein